MLRIAIITTIISLSLITRVTRIFLDNAVDFKREIFRFACVIEPFTQQ